MLSSIYTNVYRELHPLSTIEPKHFVEKPVRELVVFLEDIKKGKRKKKRRSSRRKRRVRKNRTKN